MLKDFIHQFRHEKDFLIHKKGIIVIIQIWLRNISFFDNHILWMSRLRKLWRNDFSECSEWDMDLEEQNVSEVKTLRKLQTISNVIFFLKEKIPCQMTQWKQMKSFKTGKRMWKYKLNILERTWINNNGEKPYSLKVQVFIY